MINHDEIANIYGPPARYSEHTIGDEIIYDEEIMMVYGTILYVCAPLARDMLPVRYIVDVGMAYPVDIPASYVIEDNIPREPAMMQCPYCIGMHYVADIDRCPLNPKRYRY